MFRALRNDVELSPNLFQKVTAISGRPASELYVSLYDISTMKGFTVSKYALQRECTNSSAG